MAATGIEIELGLWYNYGDINSVSTENIRCLVIVVSLFSLLKLGKQHLKKGNFEFVCLKE